MHFYGVGLFHLAVRWLEQSRPIDRGRGGFVWFGVTGSITFAKELAVEGQVAATESRKQECCACPQNRGEDSLLLRHLSKGAAAIAEKGVAIAGQRAGCGVEDLQSFLGDQH